MDNRVVAVDQAVGLMRVLIDLVAVLSHVVATIQKGMVVDALRSNGRTSVQTRMIPDRIVTENVQSVVSGLAIARIQANARNLVNRVQNVMVSVQSVVSGLVIVRIQANARILVNPVRSVKVSVQSVVSGMVIVRIQVSVQNLVNHGQAVMEIVHRMVKNPVNLAMQSKVQQAVAQVAPQARSSHSRNAMGLPRQNAKQLSAQSPRDSILGHLTEWCNNLAHSFRMHQC